MKKVGLFLFIIISCISLNVFSQEDPVLMKIEGEDIYLSEFENIYNKNNSVETAEHKSKDEYLELFINYKLKVKEAEALGLDTLKSFQKELNGYKKQLAKPYLIDTSIHASLIKEAYDRLKHDVNASHILVKVAADAPPTDTLKAYNKIMEYRKRLVKKNEDFEKVKQEIQRRGDNSVISEDLGYFTAFQMVYPFESGAYNTEKGKISEPIRTAYGYHLIKVWDKRASLGEVRVAHIMIKSNEKSSQKEKENAQQKITEIYEKLQEGQPFDSLARIYSDDRQSATRGGELKPFTSGKMVKEFEEASFALKNDGDISKPIKTDYGWHIIKRISKKDMGTFDEMESELKQRVQRDRRGVKSEEFLVQKLKEEYDFNENEDAYSSVMDKLAKEIKEDNLKNADFKKMNKELFTLNDTKYSNKKSKQGQQDFIAFVQKSRGTKNTQSTSEIKKYLASQYEGFVKQSILTFEEENLEYKYKPYKLLAKEYRDGILLFDLMDKKIWSKAISDTTGLKAFYEDNKTLFMWPKRVDATIYQCANEQIAVKAKKLVKKINKGKMTNEELKTKLNETSQLNIAINSGTFQPEENDILSKVEWKEGISENVNHNNQVYFVNIKNVMEPQPKKLDEARGLVTSEYQTYLENEWIKELRNKYSITVNREVLSLIK